LDGVDNMKKIGIDCGANVGLVTQDLLNHCDHVYCFEPNPFAFKVLESRLSGLKNVTCFNKAVLDRQDKVKLFFHENSHKNEVEWSTGSSLLDFKGNVLKEKFIEVEAVDLCQFIKKLDSPIEILKIDVEGVEYGIVNKLIDTELIYDIKNVFVEVHAKKIPELKEKEEQLKKRIADLNLKNINLDWV